MNAEKGTAERRSEIIHLLAHAGSVDVADLAARFSVAAPTVRRDLEWLVEQGLAQRVRGGAVAVQGRMAADQVDSAVARIGQAALGLVQNGETVFISPGRLTLQVARALAEREHLTIVTNGLGIAMAVAEGTTHNLILTGGQLERENQGLGGHLAQAALDELRADRVFLELSGVSAVAGLTDDNLAHADLARRLLQLGAQTAVVVAPERLGRVAAGFIGPATEVDTVITAREADAAPLWDLTELGVYVLLA